MTDGEQVMNESTDYIFQPMHPQYRAQQCRHVGCIQPATQVRYRKSLIGSLLPELHDPIDKSSKSFVCEEHLLTKEV